MAGRIHRGIALSLLLLVGMCRDGFAAQSWVPVSGTEVAVDSLDGVEALYTEEKNAGNDPVYSCAAYVKKYYKEVYGVTVFNLMDKGPPTVSEKGHVLVKQALPAVGDILFWPAGQEEQNHSAIVKAFDGREITIIEQNYKTATEAGVQAAVGRTVPFPNQGYEIWRLADGDAARQQAGVIGKSDAAYLPDDLVLDGGDTVVDVFAPVYTPPDLIIGMGTSPPSLAMSEDAEKPKAEEQSAPPPVENPAPEDTAAPVFSDVAEGHWAYDAVNKCVALGFFSGYEDGTFRPDTPINRSELAVILTKAANGSPVEGDTGFQDVDFLSWYNGYIGFAKQYIAGYTLEGHSFFAPLSEAERADVCQAVALLLGVDLEHVDTSILQRFSDSGKINKERQQAVSFCVQAGVVTGYEDGTFQGSAPVTRGQMAMILSRVY